MVIERKKYLEELISFKDKELIKVVTGIRRCGKSTLFDLYIDYLKKNGIKDEQIIREYKERIDKNRIPEDQVKEYVDLAFKFASLVIRAQNDVEYSVLSPSNDFDPWLRLYLAENLPNKDKIYRDYEEAASQQLIENPALAKELKNRQIEIKFRDK